LAEEKGVKKKGQYGFSDTLLGVREKIREAGYSNLVTSRRSERKTPGNF